MVIPSVSISGSMTRMQDIGSSFAADLKGRIAGSNKTLLAKDAEAAAESTAVQNPDTAVSEEKSLKQSQLDSLESALSGTVRYMVEKHGDQAASAMIGLIYKAIGEEGVTERNLGEAFLDVTRFIDRNFGTAAGDDFLGHLNGSLNDSLNDFFENGLTEQFIAVTVGADGKPLGGTVKVDGVTEALNELTREYAEAVQSMVEKMREETENGNAYGQADKQALPLGVLADLSV